MTEPSNGRKLAVIFIILCVVFSAGVWVGGKIDDTPCYEVQP